MDETSLRRLLDSALAHEPPMGPVAQRSLRAGIRLRGRRRARNAAASCGRRDGDCGAGARGRRGAEPRPGRPGLRGRVFAGQVSKDHTATAYVVSNEGHPGTVTPISETTSRPGRPITVSEGAGPITILPGGKTGYVSSDTEPGWVTPVNLRTGALGRPARAGRIPDDGGHPRREDGLRGQHELEHGDPARYGHEPGSQEHQGRHTSRAVVVTPDGRTAYVLNQSGDGGRGSVTPMMSPPARPGSRSRSAEARWRWR